MKFDEYQALLARHLLPSRVFATKPSLDSPDDQWCYGDDRSILHNCWWLIVGDEHEVQRQKSIATFESVVDRQGTRMTHPRLLSDLLTAKILCIQAISVGRMGKPILAHSVVALLHYHDWFVRWRLSLGIKRNRSLRKIHFDDFVEKATGHEVIDLLPWRERLAAMFEQSERGRLNFKIFDDSLPKLIAWTSMAEFLGVTLQSIARSPTFRSELVDHLAGQRISDRDRTAIGSVLQTSRLPEKASTGDDEDGLRKAGTLDSYFNTWAFIRHLSVRKLISHDPLEFDPYGEKSLRKLTVERGGENGRTGTLHPDDFVRLLDLSARWVVEYAEYICGAAEELRSRTGWPKHRAAIRRHRHRLEDQINSRRPQGAPPISLLWSDNGSAEGRRDGYLPVGVALKFLQIAALILISCFAARRLNEVLSLQIGCLKARGESLYLNTFIHKTLSAKLEVPVPEVVRLTIEMLERMTATTRAATGQTWLFRVAKGTLKPKSFVGKRLDQALNEFVELNNLAPPAGTSKWNLASHQFRRGFAVFYFHGFEWAEIEGLSLFLGHYDPGMTEIYVNEILAGEIGRFRDRLEARRRVDKEKTSTKVRKEIRDVIKRLQELVSDFGDAGVEAHAIKMLKLHRGDENPIGKGVPKLLENLHQAQEQAQAYVRIGSRTNSPEVFENTLMDVFKKQAYNHYLTPTPDRSALCDADQTGNTDLSTRECAKRARSVPAFYGEEDNAHWSAAEIVRAFSSANVCLTCIHGCLFEHNKRVVGAKRDRLDNARKFAATPDAAHEVNQLLMEFDENIRLAENAAAEVL